MNKTVMITGANGGIGRAMVSTFARSGYDVVANIRTDSDEFNMFIDELKKNAFVSIDKAIFDVTDSIAMKQSILDLKEKKIFIDVLVNCVGMAGGNLLAITPMSEIRKIFDVNLFSYMELTQWIARAMIRKKKGCIINMASFEGLRFYPGNSGYGVSKAAVIAWTQVMAKELGDYGIRVNAIAPGFVDTKMARNTPDEERNKIIEESAIKRMAKPEEIADTALFLASDKASFITGTVVRADGGMI